MANGSPLQNLGTIGTPRHGQLRWLWLSAAMLLLDQLSKYWIVSGFELNETRRVLPVLNFSYWRNTGAAFSFLHDGGGWQRWLFTALAVAASVALVVWLARLARHANLLAAALALILAGALGNLLDRVRLGYVNDFIQVHWGEHYFAIFNIADAAITVGAMLLLLDAWFGGRGRVQR